MTEKLKKTGREYVLSDSSVNEYGFRLLTSGYELESFRKNPIGYYMHRREEGIALKWDDLRIEGDMLLGTPVINLCNARGEQIYDEVENGFLNAASVGHIVVLEYSTDEAMMLPGQTGPTITRWYNKECSLVDIPGNSNALTKLYDAQEQELNLAGMKTGHSMLRIPDAGLCAALHLPEGSSAETLTTAVQELMQRATQLEADATKLASEKLALQEQLTALQNAGKKATVHALLDRALEDHKITTQLREQLAHDYADNAEGLRTLIAAMPAYRTIA